MVAISGWNIAIVATCLGALEVVLPGSVALLARSQAPGSPFTPSRSQTVSSARTSSTSPAAHMRSTRASVRSARSLAVQSEIGDLVVPVVRRHLPRHPTGQDADLEGAPTRRPLVGCHPAGRRLVESREPGVQGKGAVLLELGLQRRPQLGWVPGKDSSSRAARGVRRGRARRGPRRDVGEQLLDDGPGQGLVSRSSSSAGDIPDQAQWCATYLRSASVSLAVPTSMPR